MIKKFQGHIHTILQRTQKNSNDKGEANIFKTFWSFEGKKTDYLTHALHPYTAKFVPQLPSILISFFTEENDTVFDPFCGSGTVLLEARALNRNSIGTDASPLAILITKVKVNGLDKEKIPKLKETIEELRKEINILYSKTGDIQSIITNLNVPNFYNRDKWFDPISSIELTTIRNKIFSIKDQQLKEFLLVILSSIIIRVSKQDSETRYCINNEKHIVKYQVINEFEKKVKDALISVESLENLKKMNCQTTVDDSRKLKSVSDESVDFIVTSPPYLNAWDYNLYHRFRFLWLGLDVEKYRKKEIGAHLAHSYSEDSPDKFFKDMEQSMQRFFEVLKNEKYCCIVIGNSLVKGKIIDSIHEIEKIGEKIGFSHIMTIKRKIPQTTKRMNAKLGRIKEESIVIFKKGGKISSSGKFLYSFTLQDYVRQKFERKISLLQLSRKFGDCFLSEYKTKIFILSNKLIDTKTLRKFAFFKRVQVISNKEFLTIVPDQAFFEYSSFLSKFADDEEKLNYYIERIINNHFGNKESKYLAHSFHEYIGRFYPQIVRALINAYGDDKGTILDPFSGSGTTVIESMLMSIPVIGIELNPLQNFLTKAKLRSFNIPYEDIDASISRINNKFANLNFSNIVIQNDLIPNYEKWFRKENLQQLISIKSILEKDNINNELKIFFLLVLSSIIKEVSNWVPGQARVRLGKKPLNIVDVFSLFRKRVKEYRDLIKVYQAMDKYLKIEPRQARVHNIDARQMDIIPDKSISLIVTSPPYANALPYIETDKLAGYLLGFLKNTNYIDYINKEIGNREVSSIERVQLEEEFLRNYNSLSWGDGCKRLIKNIYLKNKDLPRENFRRRDHAAVLYKYYKGIYQTLKEMKRVLLPNGFCIIIVGNNKLRAGETLIEVKSDKYIIDMAKILGFELENVIERELTNTSNFFSKIKDESIIILKIK